MAPSQTVGYSPPVISARRTPVVTPTPNETLAPTTTPLPMTMPLGWGMKRPGPTSAPGTKSALTSNIPIDRRRDANPVLPLREALCWARRTSDAIIPGDERQHFATPRQFAGRFGRYRLTSDNTRSRKLSPSEVVNGMSQT